MQRTLSFGCLGLTALFANLPVHGNPVDPPKLTVEKLFAELLVNLDEDLQEQGWELKNAHELIVWPQGEPAEKAAGLASVARSHTLIPLPSLTGKPVKLTEAPENRDFFRGVPDPPGGVPRDGTWIGFKYVFYPNAVVNSSQVSGGGGEPLAFFLVKPAPDGLGEQEVESPLSRAAEDEQILLQRLGYDDFHQAQALLQAGRFEDALPPLQAASGTGYCHAQFLHGSYESLSLAPGSQERSRALFRLAADQGLAEAAESLAEMLQRGEGGAVDLEAARGYFRQAGEKGRPGALEALARMLQKGEGGPVDREGARAAFKQAADHDLPKAQLAYALMLKLGEGGPVDLPEARDYFGHAAAHGLAQAQSCLASMLAKGEGGPEDREAALSNALLAVAQDDAQAAQLLAELEA